MNQHWSEDRYWQNAYERFVELRQQGLSKIVLDLDAMEADIFAGDSPAYKAMEALVSVWQHEGMDGHKGAPRVVLALSLLLSEMGVGAGRNSNIADHSALMHATKFRHNLVLSVAWRLLTELFRRHASTHDLRLLQTHPASSQLGQLRLLVNPRVGHVYTGTQLALSLGGATGTYEVYVGGTESSSGDFLMSVLSGGMAAVLDRVEKAMGLRAPDQIPTSTLTVLSMRGVAELLTSSWLDRPDRGMEAAWFDFSGEGRIQPWASHFGVNVTRLQAGLDSGTIGWEEAFLEVSHLFRLGAMTDGVFSGNSLVMNMRDGVITIFEGHRLGKSFALQPAYIKHGRRLEPLLAELLIELRR